MGKYTFINGNSLPGMPWREAPAEGSGLPLWRYGENPIIRRNPLPGVARIFNSAVIPWEGAYIGVFRAERTNGIPMIYLGHSKDGLHWDLGSSSCPSTPMTPDSSILTVPAT